MARSILLLALSAVAASATTAPSSITKAPAATAKAEKIWVPLYSEPKSGVEASVIAANKDVTTVGLGCGDDADSSCILLQDQTLTYGPSTAAYIFTYGGDEYEELGVDLDLTQSVDCTGSKEQMRCAVNINGTANGSSIRSVLQMATAGYLKDVLTVAMTGGVDKLTAAATATDKASAGSAATTAATATATGTTEAATGTTETASGTTETASAGAASSTTADNGMGAFATQNALLAGAALMVGGAAALL